MVDAEMARDLVLLSRIRSLPEMEHRIVEMVVERIHAGLKEYGAWDRREHNCLQDILEEQLDTAVYSSAAMIGLLDEKQEEPE